MRGIEKLVHQPVRVVNNRQGIYCSIDGVLYYAKRVSGETIDKWYVVVIRDENLDTQLASIMFSASHVTAIEGNKIVL